MTNYIIDARGIAHTRSTCEEVTSPCISEVPAEAVANNGFVICADCEVDLPPCGDPDCGDCAICIPDDMGDYLAWERESYNRELEAESLGRPLFPNEY